MCRLLTFIPDAFRYLPGALALVVVSWCAAALAHHPAGEEYGISIRTVEGTTSFHYRDARLEALGMFRPGRPREGQPVQVSFTSSVLGQRYEGPARIVFIGASGARVESEAVWGPAGFTAVVEAAEAGAATLRLEMPAARGAGVMVPVEVEGATPWGLLSLGGGAVFLTVGLVVSSLRGRAAT